MELSFDFPLGEVIGIHPLVVRCRLSFFEPDIYSSQVPSFNSRSTRVNSYELHAILAIDEVELIREVNNTFEKLCFLYESGLCVDLQLLILILVSLLKSQIDLAGLANVYSLRV